MHTNYEESQVLAGRVIAAIGRHKTAEDIFAIVDGDTTSGKDATEQATSAKLANRFLYGIVLDQIKNTLLIAYLQTNHLNKGKDALNYILGCFRAGDDVNKLEAALARYLKILENGIPEEATTDEANAILTELTNCRATLNAATDTTYHVPNGLHSRFMVAMVAKRGKAFADELRLQRGTIDKTESGTSKLENVASVAACLDGVMRYVESQNPVVEKKPAQVLRAQAEKCEFCNVAHFGKCYTKMLTEGKTPDKWNKLSKDQRERIVKRAEEKKPGCTSNISVLICAMPCAPARKTSAPDTFEMLVDTQAAPGHKFHFWLVASASVGCFCLGWLLLPRLVVSD